VGAGVASLFDALLMGVPDEWGNAWCAWVCLNIYRHSWAPLFATPRVWGSLYLIAPIVLLALEVYCARIGWRWGTDRRTCTDDGDSHPHRLRLLAVIMVGSVLGWLRVLSAQFQWYPFEFDHIGFRIVFTDALSVVIFAGVGILLALTAFGIGLWLAKLTQQQD